MSNAAPFFLCGLIVVGLVAAVYTVSELYSMKEKQDFIIERVRDLETNKVLTDERILDQSREMRTIEASLAEMKEKIVADDKVEPQVVEKEVMSIEPTVRVFTSMDGKTIRAQVLGVSGADVTIRRLDGREFTIPITMLRNEDQLYIAEWRVQNGSGDTAISGDNGDIDWASLFKD